MEAVAGTAAECYFLSVGVSSTEKLPIDGVNLGWLLRQQPVGVVG